MKNNYMVNHISINTVYNKLIDIIKLGLDEDADFEEVFNLYLDTYIFILWEDGLYLECLPIDYEDEDLVVVLNALMFEGEEHINSAMIWDIRNDIIYTNNENITTESIEQYIANNKPCFPINYYFEELCKDKINRNLGMSLYQGFTLDMVNNLENWNYD